MKNYLVYGLGVSGIAAADFLIKNYYNTYIYDDCKDRAKEYIDACFIHKSAQIIDKLNTKTLKDIVCIILSPGVAIPKKVKKIIDEADITIMSELSFASTFCPAKIIAVTGTNGKTTTVNLLNEIFCQGGYTTHLVGNVGNPFIKEVDKIAPNDIVICEVSSFQMEHSECLKVDSAAFLNIAPDHLDRYMCFDDYFNAKKSLLSCVDKGKILLNFDDKKVREIGSKDCFYLSEQRLPYDYKGFYLENNEVFFAEGDNVKKVCEVPQHIKQVNNCTNILCAVGFAYLFNIKSQQIENALKNFEKPKHRIEYVGTIAGAEYYNDSKGTNTGAAMYAISCFKNRNIILLLGGSDKGEDLNSFINNLPKNVKLIVTFGKTGKVMEKFAKIAKFRVIKCKKLYNAVQIAKQNATKDDVVLFSPACASFDEFDNYEERGNAFINYVMEQNLDGEK